MGALQCSPRHEKTADNLCAPDAVVSTTRPRDEATDFGQAGGTPAPPTVGEGVAARDKHDDKLWLETSLESFSPHDNSPAARGRALPGGPYCMSPSSQRRAAPMNAATCPFVMLPSGALHEIFVHLSSADLLHLAMTCKSSRALVLADWRRWRAVYYGRMAAIGRDAESGGVHTSAAACEHLRPTTVMKSATSLLLQASPRTSTAEGGRQNIEQTSEFWMELCSIELERRRLAQDAPGEVARWSPVSEAHLCSAKGLMLHAASVARAGEWLRILRLAVWAARQNRPALLQAALTQELLLYDDIVHLLNACVPRWMLTRPDEHAVAPASDPVESLLGMPLDGANYRETNLLLETILAGASDVLRFLISLRMIDVNVPTSCPPLHAAVAVQSREAVQLLVRNAGCEENYWMNNAGLLPPLHLAVALGNVGIVQTLLAHGASSIDLRSEAYGTLDGGLTALIIAVLRQSTGLVQMLLRAGADVNVAREDGMTALLLAAQLANDALVELLLAHGATMDVAAAAPGWWRDMSGVVYDRLEERYYGRGEDGKPGGSANAAVRFKQLARELRSLRLTSASSAASTSHVRPAPRTFEGSSDGLAEAMHPPVQAISDSSRQDDSPDRRAAYAGKRSTTLMLVGAAAAAAAAANSAQVEPAPLGSTRHRLSSASHVSLDSTAISSQDASLSELGSPESRRRLSSSRSVAELRSKRSGLQRQASLVAAGRS